ncbi:polysaccharide deacetylase family protein [Caulobacter endophyticus]|uniref:Chitooligosaccharide deacetylase n=1 Tax=Caulobacter endophyticus TaxID=2172652 RepID=A0A2T9JRV0_9CAUL|nr:polysaccharide deacetylase family protein [Caulobacter endophyticus]PVM86430.1 allantoinase [Caulobacter endophyticus]
MPAPEDFRWPDGSRLALSIVVNVEEGAEHNIRDGDKGPEPVDELGAVPKKPMRMHGSESNYLYGIKAGAPRILRILDRYGVEATWTAAALALERAPDLAAAIRARGDEVAAHGYRWTHQFWMDEAREREFITKAADSIERTIGARPSGWLSRYLHTDNTRRLIAEAGFSYHMDDYSDDFPFWDRVETSDGQAKLMVILPYAMDSNDMKFWLAPSLTAKDWLDYAVATFDELHAESQEVGARMMSLGLHLRIIGRPGRIGAFRKFLDHVTAQDGVWIACRRKIAQAFAEAVPIGD